MIVYENTSFEIPAHHLIDSKFLEKKIVVFDCQSLQGPSFSRGIGRYSRALINSFSRSNPSLGIVLFFNSFENQNKIEDVVSMISMDQTNLRIMLSDYKKSDSSTYQEMSLYMTHEIARIDPHLVILLSIFEHPHNVIPLRVSEFKKSAAILYDVIPLQFPEIFLKTEEEASVYMSNLDRLLSVDMLLSISNTSVANLKRFCEGTPTTKMISGSGYFNHPANLGLNLEARRGIMCVGSDSAHKNIRNAIHAYSLLPLSVKNIHPLHILGVSSRTELKKLQRFALANRVEIITHGYLGEDSLSQLYKECRLTIAPSWEEGFGMPVVEAWQDGCVVLGSEKTALAEILDSSDLTFNPFSSVDISRVMTCFLTDDSIWLKEQQRLLRRRSSFSWENSSGLLLDSIKGFLL
jgi:glycosyltransferase involved in cell wall biosynthesis